MVLWHRTTIHSLVQRQQLHRHGAGFIFGNIFVKFLPVDTPKFLQPFFRKLHMRCSVPAIFYSHRLRSLTLPPSCSLNTNKSNKNIKK